MNYFQAPSYNVIVSRNTEEPNGRLKSCDLYLCIIMKRNGKFNGNQSPQRYLANAKETISKSPIEDGHYSDVKYVTEAAGIAYIAVRNAIFEYATQKGIELKETPKTYQGMSHLINQLSVRNKLHQKFKDVYDILHTGAYYNAFNRVSVIKEGFKEAENILKMLN